MKSVFKLVILLFLVTVSTPVWAQNACEKLFADGVKLQQTMTISSQKKAISFFEKAKVCYDSQAKKELCDQQIKACRNIIKQIDDSNKAKKEAEEQNNNPSGNMVQEVEKDSVPAKEEKKNVKLSFGSTYVKFKGKGGDFQKVKVNCNYEDWEVVEAPEWINYSRNENDELVIEVDRNPLTEERSGNLKVKCGEEEASLTIIQEKYKKFIIFLKNKNCT